MSKDSQLAIIDGRGITERDVFSAIDTVLFILNKDGNISQATTVLNTLDRLDNVAGKAKSKLLWGMNLWFNKNKPDDDFGDYVESLSEDGTKRVTVLRYVNVWQQIEDENIPRDVQRKPMRQLVPIATMLEQGFQPTKREWEEINLCSNSSELGEIIRTIKGKKARKSGMTIQMERDGSLYVYVENRRTYLGYLDVKEMDNQDVDKAITRIIDGASIIRR